LNDSIGTAVVDLVSPNDNNIQQILVAAIDFVERTAPPYADSVILTASERFDEVFTALREALRQKLHSYMVPTAFVPFAKVPLNASGKTDRRAVKKILESHSMQDLMPCASIKSAPQEVKTEAEKILRSLWADILQMDEVTIGSENDFFSLGADSILAMRLIGAGNSRGIKLDIKKMYSGTPLWRRWLGQWIKFLQMRLRRQSIKAFHLSRSRKSRTW
jgi:aryl carrier-like protein